MCDFHVTGRGSLVVLTCCCHCPSSASVFRHPVEVARQLTKIESELYRSIKASELTGQGWTKANKQVRAPNVLNMINRFNQVSHRLDHTREP